MKQPYTPDPAPASGLPAGENSLGRWIFEGARAEKDPITGVTVRQVTTQVTMATNIYGEDPYCSSLCHRAVFLRSHAARNEDPIELWIYDWTNDRTQLLDLDMRPIDLAGHAYSDFFLYTTFSSGGRDLVRLRLSTLERELVHRIPDHLPPFARWGAITPDGRYLANVRMDDHHEFHVVVIDLETNRENIVASGHDLCNAHVSFDRLDASLLFVQQNRGQRCNPQGQIETIDPQPGATLFLVPRIGGDRIELPIARPRFPGSISGHEAWVRGQHQLVYSLAGSDAPFKQANRRGNLFAYTLGDNAPKLIVDDPVYHGHVSTSQCGNYWINDRFTPDQGILIAAGNLHTGRWKNICQMGGTMWPREIGHAHPYLSSDGSRVFFTSTRTGTPQVFEALLPEGFLEVLS